MINQAANSLATAVLMGRPISPAFELQLAAGILGQFFNPLNVNRLAAAVMPDLMLLRCFAGCNPGQIWGPPPFGRPDHCLPDIGIPTPVEPAPQWVARMTGEGTADVDLGDGYTLKFNERSSQIEIFNANTGEHTRIWGDPHVDVDGKRAFDFWGTTTFTLENGTKITINTEQWNGNPNAYVASQVVVTNETNALVIDGISQNELGDLQLTMKGNAYRTDKLHRDGFVLYENGTGAGWRSEHTGAIATQEDLNATRVGREYGPGSELQSLEEMLPLFRKFLAYGIIPQVNPFLTISPFVDMAIELADEIERLRPAEPHLDRL